MVFLSLLLEVFGEGNIFQRLEVLDAVGCIDVVTCLGNPPHGLPPWCWVVVVQSLWFEVGLEGCGGLLGVVKGHFVEQVVSNMCASNAMMEKIKDSVGAVNGRQCPLDPSPLLSTVVRDGWVGVLEPSVENQPKVHVEIRAPEPKSDGESTMLVHQVADSCQGGNCGDGRENDFELHLGREHG